MFHTYTSTGNDLRCEGQVSFLVGEFVTHQVVHCELDGLLWRHTNQLGHQASVQACKTLVPDDLCGKVK